METVRVLRAEEFSPDKFLKENPLKTDRVAFSIYNFKPWQALPMHRHPRNDTVLYIVEGEGNMYINDEVTTIDPDAAIYVPSGVSYGILSGENDMVLVSIQGPAPVESVFEETLEYDCPVCYLKTPLTTDAADDCLTQCPRCNTMLRLAKEAEVFKAEKMEGSSPEWTGAAGENIEVDVVEEVIADPEGHVKAEPAKIALNVYNFQPWMAMPMRRHPDSDTMLYIVNGQAIMFVDDEEMSVDPNMAIYVPAGSTYGILSADNEMVVISVQGPTPVRTELAETLEYDCPICNLETPVTVNTYDGCITVCPRCNIKIKLTQTEDRFKAEETREPAPTEVSVQ